MKIAIITDTHCGAGNDNQHLNEFFLKFYEDVFFPYIKANNIKTVIHLGDTFDRRKYINFNTLHSWQKRVFSSLNELCDRVDILIGNHDTYYKNTNSVNSVNELLKIYDKFNVYENSSEVFIENTSILYVPWICEDNYSQTMSMIESSKSSICMGHLELIGFEMYGGHINADKGLRSEIFDKFYMTLSGHFHQKSSRGNIHYLGAPYAMMWGDYGSIKGFHVLDTDTMSLSFVENPIHMFHKIYYDDSCETYDSLMEKNHDELKEKFVKIIVRKKTNPYWFDQYFEKIQKINPADISIIESSFEDSVSSEVDIDEAKDTLTILKECVESLSVDEYKNSLNDLLRELYTESLNTNEHIQSNG
ncbi:SbcD DNA repair exonuclease [uncultured Caudovirales phage]|uniref:SbcD DNA repair exonuclease n=1 Tax=uncultured Caudovirales phage TaxID=2100421 RepID=A0A6J5MBU1_9CAUD|nr:SbcD DNA repair exonuclease [uncultured Caudovirales phage]